MELWGFLAFLKRFDVDENIFARNIRQLVAEKALLIHTKSNLSWDDIYSKIYAGMAEQTGIPIETIELITMGKTVPKFTERHQLCQYFNLPERLVRTYKFYDNSVAPAFEQLRDKTKAH
jgi:hypothetical protein